MSDFYSSGDDLKGGLLSIAAGAVKGASDFIDAENQFKRQMTLAEFQHQKQLDLAKVKNDYATTLQSISDTKASERDEASHDRELEEIEARHKNRIKEIAAEAEKQGTASATEINAAFQRADNMLISEALPMLPAGSEEQLFTGDGTSSAKTKYLMDVEKALYNSDHPDAPDMINKIKAWRALQMNEPSRFTTTAGVMEAFRSIGAGASQVIADQTQSAVPGATDRPPLDSFQTK